MHFLIQCSLTHLPHKHSLKVYYVQAESKYSREEEDFEYFKVGDNLRGNHQKLLQHRFPRKTGEKTQKKDNFSLESCIQND